MKTVYRLVGASFLFVIMCIVMNIETAAAAATWKPVSTDAFYIQLQGNLKVPKTATVIVIDLFDTSAGTIAKYKKEGKKVICYFSAGTREDWRTDATLFPAEAIGKDLADWAGEKWIDVRSTAVRSIMRDRMRTAATKGCDGVDADNVDSYSNTTGFPLTYTDAKKYTLWLKDTAHSLGLVIGLKNAMNLLPDVAAHYDFAINEQCHIYKECALYRDFTKLGKPVFNIEYAAAYKRNTKNAFTKACAESRSLGINTFVYPQALDGSFIKYCK